VNITLHTEPDSPWATMLRIQLGIHLIEDLSCDTLMSSAFIRDLSSLLPLFRSCTHPLPSNQNGLWSLTKDGYYSKSAYDRITHPGVQQLYPTIPWKLGIPGKVKMFLWLLSRDILLTNRNLQRRDWPCGDRCVLCLAALEEDANHIFFICPYARRIWNDILPSNFITQKTFSDLTHGIMKAHTTGIKQEQLMTAACWNIWKEHNRRIFQDV
jgi:zinc-binding in reverse transcriptase